MSSVDCNYFSTGGHRHFDCCPPLPASSKLTYCYCPPPFPHRPPLRCTLQCRRHRRCRGGGGDGRPSDAGVWVCVGRRVTAARRGLGRSAHAHGHRERGVYVLRAQRRCVVMDGAMANLQWWTERRYGDGRCGATSMDGVKATGRQGTAEYLIWYFVQNLCSLVCLSIYICR